MFQLLQPDAVFDFGFDVSVGGAGSAIAIGRSRRAAAGESREYRGRNCCQTAPMPNSRLALSSAASSVVSRTPGQFVSAGGQIVVIFCRSQLRHLQRLVRRQAHDKGDVVRRTGGGANAFIFSIRKAVSFPAAG
jgi:hypothetical protein